MDQHFNPDKQHTLKDSISISGTGLHTGVLVDMKLNPANPGFGIQFQRVDLTGILQIILACKFCHNFTNLERMVLPKPSTIERIMDISLGTSLH